MVEEEVIVLAFPVPVYVCVNVPVPEEMARLELFWIVTVPFEVSPEVAVMSPEIVGVAVQAVPVTVRFPPNVVRLEPETVKVLSKVVAPCKVRAPGVVAEPMVLIDEAPEPKVFVVLIPVAKVVLPEEVRVVNAPEPAVVIPMLVKLAATGVVTPIAVELIPVAVVLKFPAVKRMLFAPKDMEEDESPDSVSVPEVAVRFKAPVVKVKPLEAVRVEENLPVPVMSKVVPGAVVPMPTLPASKIAA